MFNLLYAKALKRYQAELLEENIPALLRYTRGAPCVTCTGETAPNGDAIVLDVTFVDDEAVIVTASVPRLPGRPAAVADGNSTCAVGSTDKSMRRLRLS